MFRAMDQIVEVRKDVLYTKVGVLYSKLNENNNYKDNKITEKQVRLLDSSGNYK